MALLDDIAGAGALPWWQQAWPDGPPSMGQAPLPFTDELAGAPQMPPVDQASGATPAPALPVGPPPPPIDVAPPMPPPAPMDPYDAPQFPPPEDPYAAPPLPYGAGPKPPAPVAGPPPLPPPSGPPAGSHPETPITPDLAYIDDAALPGYLETHPHEKAIFDADLEDRRNKAVLQKQADLDQQMLQQRADSTFEYQKAYMRSQDARNKLLADSQALANTKTDRGRWYGNLSEVGKAGAWVAALAGGLYAGTPAGGGRNTGMEWIDKQVNADTEAQQADIHNRATELTRQQGIVGDQAAADELAYRMGEQNRIANYMIAKTQIQTFAQQFDPRSTRAQMLANAALEIDGRIGQVADAHQQRDLKNSLDMYKAQTDRGREMETQRHNMVEEGIKANKGKGGAAIAGAHGDYKVPLMLDDPFTHEPLFAKYSLGKEEDAARHKEAGTTIQEYKQLRSITNEMIQLAGDGKGWDEVLTGGRTRTTKGERYDNLRNTAVSITAKLNDGKTGIGILELNEKLIPERKTSLSLADTGELLRDFQRDGDERLASTLDTAGIDSSGILKHARQASQPAPTLAADERARIARESVAQNPGSADAKAELNNAEFHASLADMNSQVSNRLVENFTGATDMTPLKSRDEAGTGPEFSAVREANKDIANYNEKLGKFHDELRDKSYLDGIDKEKKGDVAAAERKRSDQIRGQAAELANVHSKAVESLSAAIDARKDTDAFIRGGKPAQALTGPNSALPDVPPELTLGPSQSMRPEQPKRKGKH